MNQAWRSICDGLAPSPIIADAAAGVPFPPQLVRAAKGNDAFAELQKEQTRE